MFGHVLLTVALLGQVEKTENTAPADDAQEQARQKLRKEVDKLEREILRGDLNQRERATQKLLELGPDVLEVLRPTDASTPGELRIVLDNVRKQLERKVAESAGKASLVTLKGEMLLSQAIAALEKQSGNKMIDSRERRGQEVSDPKLKLDLEKVPFWKAVDVLCDYANLTMDYPDQRGVALVARGEGDRPLKERAVTYVGPLRIEVVELVAKRNLRRETERVMDMNLEIFWEPRLMPINIALPLAGISAVDENGKPVETFSKRGEAEVEIKSGAFFAELTLPFALPSRDVKKIAAFQGKLEFLVPGRIGTFEFEKLERNQKEPRTQTVSGVDVILDGVRQNDEVWQARVIVGFKNAEGALASHRSWVLNNETYLLDAAGKRIDFDGFETFRRTENEIGVAYSYDLEKGPDGLKLVYKTPSVIMNLPLDLEIKNIDLP